ncbi:hypothetical protein Q5741_19910 [Paenibacillus sp. JX-17]|uniref:Haem-binding uptake Tiki superfamily ChaN domain-containing protein n=1 Tax=Paenibacillus lacisoli TaxID=3064525 RepID=A0ABT9CH96_9BACL|nr:hypothetical protein [Paenibacillus sp. JX-17]MDO7908658.1 hypothetical protein [Paenibacillus sp. JX-17]
MTTVGILGVVHDDELRQKYGLSLNVIEELILEFEPDVICGEVLPASWAKYQEDPAVRGYWGEPASEYWELIFPLCEERQIEFVPIDWVELDVWLDFDPFLNYEEEQQQQLNNELEQWFEKQLTACRSGLLPFNSADFDKVTTQKYEWLEQMNPRAQILRWECRHLIMIQRIRNAIRQHKGKRVLCIVGADHNHVLYKELSGEQDLHVVYPLRT